MEESERSASLTARKCLIAGASAIVGVLRITPTRGVSFYLSAVCVVVALVLGIKAVRIKRETDEDTVLPALAVLLGSALALLIGSAFVFFSMWAMH